MHERSLVRVLLDQVDRLVAEKGGTHAVGVRVSVGEFSGVEPELFRVAFDDLVRATVHRGARLEMEIVPLQARCQICNSSFAVVHFRFVCPHCGGRRTTVTRGEGLLLESITLEGPQG